VHGEGGIAIYWRGVEAWAFLESGWFFLDELYMIRLRRMDRGERDIFS